MNERTEALVVPATARPAILRLVVPAYRRLTLAIWVLLMGVALTLLTIGARSPYTHSNLSAGYDQRYDRTAQIVVGDSTEFGGVSPSTASASGDATTRGASLYVTAGCVTCHALEGRGGPVGPAIAGIDAETLTQRVREGPAGMPRFSASGLTNEEIADITAYLESVVPAK
jgi:mono/diheme cytochrome c family protein